MASNGRTVPHLHGNGEVAVSRYFALYLAQVGWLVLGVYLFAHAYWPSSCRPETFLEVYSCSMRLAENRGWIDTGLMTWLWSTPILVILELMRHYDRFQQRRRR